MAGYLEAAFLTSSRLLHVGPGSVIGPDVNPVVGLFSGAIGAFLTTLVVGGIMVALAPGYTERTMETLREEPVGAFIYGFVALVFVVLVTVVLAITLVGLVVAIPFAILAYAVWAVGSAVAFLTIGERLVGRDDDWLRPLLVGAGIDGVLTLTGIGGLVAFAVGAAGFGAVLHDGLH